ncbi:hypothetical protein EAT51_00055 [Pseudoxanthomonas winnipegensis]|uniref:hypothetical protein n=1 Tax=Pseudoxanthomonas winnipegensis TaxID=2480810 RepID=UPI00102DB50E|nr:hypothetical protein [Pseudoxanthomonas winnipegensis]TAA43835.1 hypothetical protein EAT51_00055 [Pseudoxanthomonas winnipegensis]
MSLGSVTIDLLLRTGSFTTDSKVAEKRLKDMGDAAYKAGEQIGKSIRGGALLAATGLAAAGTAAIAWTDQIVQLNVEMERLSKLSGTSSDTFQRLAAGANAVGISNEKLADILKDVQDKTGDFLQTGGGGMADFFKNIAPQVGLTAEQFRKLSGPDALQAYVNALQKAGVSQSEMTFYMEAIASDSSMLVPLLRDNGRGFREWGDEAARAGAIMGGELSENTKAMQETTARLKLAFQGMKVEVASALLPTLNEFANSISGAQMGKAFGTMTGWVGGVVTNLASGTVALVNFIDQANQLYKLANGGSVGNADYDALNARLAQINTEKRDLNSWKSNLLGIPLTDGQEKFKLDQLKALNSESEKIIRQIASLNRKAIGDAMTIIDPSDGYEAWKLGQGNGKPTGGTKKTAKEKDTTALREQILAMTDLDKAMMSADASSLDWSNRLEDLQAQLQGGLAPAMLEYKRSLAELDAAYKTGKVTSQDYATWQQALNEQLEANTFKLADTTHEATQAMTVFADQAARNMQDAFADFLFDPFQDGVKGLAENFAKTLKRMVADATAANLLKALYGGGSQYTGTLSTLFGSSWGFAEGGHVRGPGTSTSDSIPAYLSNGEYVVKADAVSKYGRGFFDAINARRYASGGYVGGQGAPVSGGDRGVTVQIENHASPVSAQATTSQAPDGSMLIKLVLNAVTDSAVNGSLGTALTRTYGLRKSV